MSRLQFEPPSRERRKKFARKLVEKGLVTKRRVVHEKWTTQGRGFPGCPRTSDHPFSNSLRPSPWMANCGTTVGLYMLSGKRFARLKRT